MEVEDFSEHVLKDNAARMHDETAEMHPDHLAVECEGERHTHGEISRWSARFAGGLRDLGLREEDRILLYLPNGPEYLVATLGAFKAGTPISPMNPQYRSREIRYQLEDTGARMIITHERLRDHVAETLEEIDRSPLLVTVGENPPGDDVPFEEVAGDPLRVPREPDDVAIQPYTSGTTGRPKGVLITHRNVVTQGYSALGGDLEPDEVRSLMYLPLYHITGLIHSTWQPLVYGGAVYMRNPLHWDAEECMRLIEEENISHFIGVTAMYVDMVNHESFGDYDLTSLEAAGEGGAKMSVTIQEEFEETTGVNMAEGYGLTETTGATHSGANSIFGVRHGTVGQPLRFTDCRIVDPHGEEVPLGEEGELLVRGPQVMKGYHDMPEANEESFTEGGWFRTGDVARRDLDNYYEIVDRKKQIIVSAGYNIYPSEVEEFLREHEAVADAAVVGLPDERRNEIPVAFVILKPGYEADVDVTEEDIKEYSLENLAAYKHPRRVKFVEEFPRTASGKIQKFRLEEQHTDET